jgi:hypothetical protein
MPQTIAQLEPLIIEWAQEKRLILHTKEQALKQHGKTEEEIQEFLEAKAELDAAIVKKCESGMWAHRELQHKVRLEAGDVLVTLVIQCAIYGWRIGDCITNLTKRNPDFTRHCLQGWTELVGLCLESGQSLFLIHDIGGLILLLEDTIRHYELTLDECLNAAWLKIRDRKGETIDGVFVKTEDLLAGLLPSYQIGDNLSGLF